MIHELLELLIVKVRMKACSRANTLWDYRLDSIYLLIGRLDVCKLRLHCCAGHHDWRKGGMLYFQNSLLVLSFFLVLVSTVACCKVAMSVGRCKRVEDSNVHISFLESVSP